MQSEMEVRNKSLERKRIDRRRDSSSDGGGNGKIVESGGDEAVFDVHGKRLVYERNSLYLFDEKSRVRAACVWVIAHPWFDRFVVLLIVLNSLVLALTDWDVINTDPDSADVGEPIEDGSWRNTLLYRTEPVFVTLYAVEFVLKVISQGFVQGQGSYLRDAWNVLDFVVLITSLLHTIPGVPSASAIRVFRVLRPLRSVSALPGLQHLVISVLKSVPELLSVVVLLLFVFVVFGIFGIQIFAGKQHSRCRLTPYPVTTGFEIGMNYTDFRCLNVSNFDTIDDDSTWTQRSSPWSSPRECWWPLDSEDTRLCAFDGSPGKHRCDHDALFMDESEFRWCGSNYDALGNRRFTGGMIEGAEWSAADLTANATFLEDLAWGYTTFDNIFIAFLTIFQSITLEGWVDILYQVKDCSLPALGDLFFIVLVLWGAFFTVNLLLAVLETNFSQGTKITDATGSTVKEQEGVLGAAAEERAVAAEYKHDEEHPGGNGSDGRDDGVDFGAVRKGQTEVAGECMQGAGEGGQGGGEGERGAPDGGRVNAIGDQEPQDNHPGWRMALRRLVENHTFQHLITSLTVLNTLVLALDHHPMDDDFSSILEGCNFTFTLCFALEMVLKLVGLGWRGYAKDKFNLFDGFIVIISLIELTIWPPDILTGGVGTETAGGLTALRSLRVFRVLKLARGWSSMRDLLETLQRTLMDIGNFGLLLLLFIFIYILIGVQFFANRFHFGEDGKVIGIGEEGYDDADVPRSNFDTLVNAFVTIFEVLTGENWNATMYSARRAVGWVSVIYFVSLVVLGMMIIMTLFLAILLSHFSAPLQDEAYAIEQEKKEERERKGKKAHVRRGVVVGAGPAERKGRNGGGGEEEEEEGVSNTSHLEERDGYNEEGDCSSPGIAASRALQRAHNSASRASWSTVEEGQSHHSNSNRNGDTGSGQGLRDTLQQQHQHRFRYRDSTSSGMGQSLSEERSAYASTETSSSSRPPGRVQRFLSFCTPAGISKYWHSAIQSVRVPDHLYPGMALCFLSAKNPLRRGCAAVVTNAGFERFIMLLILVSSIMLALDNPLLDPDSSRAQALDTVEVITTCLFAIELLLKVCASGFYFMPLAYLRDPWNILDFVVVVVSVVQLGLASGPNLIGFRSLRAMRALRPLRIINRMPGLKLVLEALVGSIPGVINVAAVCFLFYIIFAILSVNYFKGVLMSCQGDDFDALPADVVSFLEDPLSWSEMSIQQQAWFGPQSNVSQAFSGVDCGAISGDLWPDSAACCSDWPSLSGEAPTSREVCECLDLEWAETIPQQFNNVAVALLTLFEISTTEAWTSVTYAAVDSTRLDMQPIRGNVVWRVWYFIFFMLVGAYLVMNLFVGVIVENFKKMKMQVEGRSILVTEQQRAWTKTRMIMRRLRPTKRLGPPPNPLGAWCFRVVNRRWFDPVVMVFIVLNTVVMAMEYFGQSYLYTRSLDVLNNTFFSIFALEALMKILAFRKVYFKDPWNRFDFSIVVGSTIGVLSLWFMGSRYGSIVTIIRIFRIGRVLRLVRGLESMAQLFRTLIMTLPSLGNVGALLFLLFFIYAATGVQLYAKVGFLGAVTAQANFQSFWETMVLLLRFSTGENWNGFMYDMAADREGCISDPDYDPDVCGFTDHPNCVPLNGCGTWTIYPFMISFTLLITFVFLNLFIGVILDGFDTAQEEAREYITQDDFNRFADHWAKFDPRATCLISIQDLHTFLQTLFKPWGFGVDYSASSAEVRRKVRRLKLHVFHDHRVHFKDVLSALAAEVYRTESERKGEPIFDLNGNDKRKTGNSWKVSASWKRKSRRQKMYMVNSFSNTTVTLDQILAVQVLQRVFRQRAAQRRKEAEAAAAANSSTPPPHGRGDTSKSGFLAPSPTLEPLPRLLSRSRLARGGRSSAVPSSPAAGSVKVEVVLPSPRPTVLAVTQQQEVKEEVEVGVCGDIATPEELPRPSEVSRKSPRKVSITLNGINSRGSDGHSSTPGAGEEEVMKGGIASALEKGEGSDWKAHETESQSFGRTTFLQPEVGAGPIGVRDTLEKRPSVRQWSVRRPVRIDNSGELEETGPHHPPNTMTLSVASSSGPPSPGSPASSFKWASDNATAAPHALQLAPKASLRTFSVNSNSGTGGGVSSKGRSKAPLPQMVSFGSSDYGDGGSPSLSSIPTDGKEVFFPS